MKFIGTNRKGQVVFDGEGEVFQVEDAAWPVKLINLTVVERPKRFERVIDDVRISIRNSLDYPIRVSILDGRRCGETEDGKRIPGAIVSPDSARQLAQYILDAVKFCEEKG